MRNNRYPLGLIFLVLSISVSYASSDFSCWAPKGTIFLRSYDACYSVPFLSPANDSRLNLELLLIDAGKLTGTLNTTRDYPPPRDLAWLLVPFNLEDWQLHESTLGTVTPSTPATDAAASNEYAKGEGSRCSNAKDGMEAFRRAVNGAAGLPAEEAPILIAARSALVPDCNSTSSPTWKEPPGIRSAMGREFAIYISGANAFYGGDFAAALNHFKSLTNSGNPWLKETSLYMVGRTLLNNAQQRAFGEWGDLKHSNINKGDLKETEDAFNSYLRDFPLGTYAASARGLLRRVYWLANDQARMAEAFDSAFADSAKGANNVTVLELVQEADTKLLGDVEIDRIKSPQFLAIIDLMRMRTGGGPSAASPAQAALTLADLEAQKDRFASNPALYQYLLAVFHVYVDSKPDQALALLPSLPDRKLGYFAFSQQTMRVLALDAGKEFDQERMLLLQMLPLAGLPLESEQLQLALARLEEQTEHLDRVFAPDSPIRDKAVRMILVEHSASAEMLRWRIKDPKENADVVDAAVYALLYKELTGGKYQAFQADLALVPPHPSDILVPFVAAGESKSGGYQCPSLREVAATLQREKDNAHSLNCMGELVRLHSVHYGQEGAPPATDLGGRNSLFPVTNYSRMDGYLKVIANDHAEGGARSYALFRAIRCYAPAGNNACGAQEIPTGTRKQWFEMLHQEYADSTWAKSLKYYW